MSLPPPGRDHSKNSKAVLEVTAEEMKVCLDFPASFVDGGAVRDLGPTLRNLILEVFPLGKIFQPDDSWNKRASSKM